MHDRHKITGISFNTSDKKLPINLKEKFIKIVFIDDEGGFNQYDQFVKDLRADGDRFVLGVDNL